jgi:hypothetical protein
MKITNWGDKPITEKERKILMIFAVAFILFMIYLPKILVK